MCTDLPDPPPDVNGYTGSMRQTRILVVPFVLVWLLTCPSNALAECVGLNPNLPEDFQRADLVFSGTVLRAEGTLVQALTFTVDRVWKGQVTREFTVYQFLSVDSYPLQSGTAYVMFAHLLTAEKRKRNGILPDADPIFEIHTCGGPPWQPNIADLDKLAHPRRPAP